jgi:hypothetical protein
MGSNIIGQYAYILPNNAVETDRMSENLYKKTDHILAFLVGRLGPHWYQKQKKNLSEQVKKK